MVLWRTFDWRFVVEPKNGSSMASIAWRTSWNSFIFKSVAGQTSGPVCDSESCSVKMCFVWKWHQRRPTARESKIQGLGNLKRRSRSLESFPYHFSRFLKYCVVCDHSNLKKKKPCSVKGTAIWQLWKAYSVYLTLEDSVILCLLYSPHDHFIALKLLKKFSPKMSEKMWDAQDYRAIKSMWIAAQIICYG